MTRAGLVSDEFWSVVEPLMPSNEGRRGRRFGDHRLILEGIAWRFRAVAPWRDLPAEFGPWQTVWKRHHRFSVDGTYQRIFDAVREHFGENTPDEGLMLLRSVDSTIVRAHQHAAGAAPRERHRGLDRITRTHPRASLTITRWAAPAAG